MIQWWIWTSLFAIVLAGRICEKYFNPHIKVLAANGAFYIEAGYITKDNANRVVEKINSMVVGELKFTTPDY